MKLWLDDVRPPWRHGCLGWEWAKTYEEAVALLQTGKIEQASLDHDLSEALACGYACRCRDCGVNLLETVTTCPECESRNLETERTGYDVVCWLEEHPEFWPPDGCAVHSMNPVGADRMRVVIARHYAAPRPGAAQGG